MRILMAIQSLALGGAEKFFLNLAHALAESHDVTCYIPALRYGDPMMIRRLGSLRVRQIPWFTPLGYRVFYKLTLLMQRRFPTFDPEAALHMRHLHQLHRRHSFQVVNAHLMPAARQVCKAFEHIALPITKSEHGDLPSAEPKDASMLRRLDAVICPAAANVPKVRAQPLRPDCQLPVIPYGYRGSSGGASALEPFAGITFGMVARGVPDKGWAEAIAAFRLVRQQCTQPMRLVLVGGGTCLDELRLQLSEKERQTILFAGQQSEPERWVRGFDVGLLPTCLAEESLPNTIIEYLACGKPVIATAVGGIPEMTGQAGALVPLAANGRADVQALAAAMRQAVEQPAWLQAMAAATSEAFARFSMARCVQAYEAFFASLITA